MGSNQTSMLGEIGPIISAGAEFAAALQPGDAMDAMQHIDNDDSAKYVNALASYARTLGPVIVGMLRDVTLACLVPVDAVRGGLHTPMFRVHLSENCLHGKSSSLNLLQ